MPLWYPEEWEKDPGTGTGKITEQTGVAINYMVPDDNGDSRLSLMMINGKLPDIISVSDTNMIRHLIESGEVWKIEELIDVYKRQDMRYSAGIRENIWDIPIL